MREIAIMKKLDHPYLVRLHEVMDDEENEKLYMVMDYCSKGELLSWNEKTLRFHPFDPQQP